MNMSGIQNGRNKRGVVLSVEALLAAMLVFAFVMLSSTLTSAVREPYISPLGSYAQDILNAGARSGVWLAPLPPTLNDSTTRAFIESLPPSLCAQVEMRINDTTPQNLRYMYVRANCTLSAQMPIDQRWGMVMQRTDASNITPYWVLVRVYPKEG